MCAVVLPVSPLPTGPSSMTITALPARVRRYAVVRPAMPAPMTQTCARASLPSGGNESTSAVSIQRDSVAPEPEYMDCSEFEVVFLDIFPQSIRYATSARSNDDRFELAFLARTRRIHERLGDRPDRERRSRRRDQRQ